MAPKSCPGSSVTIPTESEGGEVYLLETSSLFVRFLELTPRFLFARLMKDERVSLGLQPGSGLGAALERPGIFSRRSWQPMSLTSSVPEDEGNGPVNVWKAAPNPVRPSFYTAAAAAEMQI